MTKEQRASERFEILACLEEIEREMRRGEGLVRLARERDAWRRRLAILDAEAVRR